MTKKKKNGQADRAPLLAAALGAAADFYRREGRALPWRRDRDPYHVFLSEVMLQQTRVEAVIPYYLRFLSLFPTVTDLAAAEEEAVLKAWEGLGYYSRARNLKKGAERVVSDFGGVFPDTEEGLLSLPAVGAYTAGAMGSICFGLPTPAIDGNALRIYTRLFADGHSISEDAFKREISALFRAVYPSGDRAGEVTQGLMEVGQRFCLPAGAPKCESCPLCSSCAVGRGEASYTAFPHKEKKKPRRIEQRTLLLLTDGRAFYLRRRPDTGLLAGLWEFPSLLGEQTVEGALSGARALGFTPEGGIPAVSGKHIFTHIEWHMQSVLILCRGDAPQGFVAATPEEMAEKYPIPSAFRVFLDFIRDHGK